MLKDRIAHQHQPQPAAAPAGWQPEDIEAAWERVLDCGAAGPDRAAPALFYQAGQPRANADERREEG
jgi:hypothetical protein